MRGPTDADSDRGIAQMTVLPQDQTLEGHMVMPSLGHHAYPYGPHVQLTTVIVASSRPCIKNAESRCTASMQFKLI